MQTRIAVIIINYKTPRLIVDCINSLKNEIDKKKDKVVLIDNFSNDDSGKKLDNFIKKNRYGSWINFIKSKNGLNERVYSLNFSNELCFWLLFYAFQYCQVGLIVF